MNRSFQHPRPDDPVEKDPVLALGEATGGTTERIEDDAALIRRLRFPRWDPTGADRLGERIAVEEHATRSR